LRTSLPCASTDPRRKALEVLLGLRETSFELSSRDEAFALRLVRETTVWRARLDHSLARFLSRPMQKLDSRMLFVLRLGAVQLLVLGTPVHAAVSETVKLAGNQGARGLVNAVLRRLSSEGEEPDLPLHIRWSHPSELVRRWSRRFGLKRTTDLLRWNNEPPVLGGYAFGEPPPGEPGVYLDGYRRFDRGIPLPPPGVFVQDEAAAIVARAFQSMPGDSALEIGAAPGGKTAHQQGTVLASLDLSRKRMGKWLDNMRRLGWTQALPVVGDGRELPFRKGFHKVFVDAPCSNTGVFRRRPGARWRWSFATTEALRRSQATLLHCASEYVLPGGALLYSTCSLEPEENELQAAEFDAVHPGFERLPLQLPEPLLRDGAMVSFPPESGVDGLYAVAWRRSQ
jgi:16S rRNA (cytosine967-C5)-methyltransferase